MLAIDVKSDKKMTIVFSKCSKMCWSIWLVTVSSI